MYIYEADGSITYTSDGTTPVLIWLSASVNEGGYDDTYNFNFVSDLDGTLSTTQMRGGAEGSNYGWMWGGVLSSGEHTLTLSTSYPTGMTNQKMMLQEQSFSGGSTATTSPYIIDVGSTIMLGGILAFLIAYWFVGLIRRVK